MCLYLSFICLLLQRKDGNALPVATRVHDNTQWVFLMFVGVACVGGLLVGALTIACLRTHARQLASGKLGLGPEAGNVTHYEYQVGPSDQNMLCVTFLRIIACEHGIRLICFKHK